MRKTLLFYPCIVLAVSPPPIDHDLNWGIWIGRIQRNGFLYDPFLIHLHIVGIP